MPRLHVQSLSEDFKRQFFAKLAFLETSLVQSSKDEISTAQHASFQASGAFVISTSGKSSPPHSHLPGSMSIQFTVG